VGLYLRASTSETIDGSLSGDQCPGGGAEVTMLPYQRRRLRQWFNPLRVFCAFGWHRVDGVIDGRLCHCGRCFGPFYR